MRQEALQNAVTFLCILVGLMMLVVQVGAQGEQLYVRSGLANVRMSPEIEAGNIMDKLPRGTQVTLIERQGDWYQVQLADERSGWMHQSVVSSEPASTMTAAAAPNRLPIVRIGIVLDGPGPRNTEYLALFEKAIRDVLGSDLTVQFPESMKLQGDWTAASVQSAMDQLLSNPHTEVILALGILASNDAGHRTALRKPVFAPFVLDPELQGIPAQKGTSGVPNLSYYTSPPDIAKSLRLFHELKRFTHFAMLMPQAISAVIPNVQQQLERVLQDLSFQVTGTVVPVGRTVETALAAIPEQAEVVLVTTMPQLPDKRFAQLVAGLNQRRLPSFTFAGRHDVERGLLLTLYSDRDIGRLARRVALNMQRTLLDKQDPGTFRTLLVRQERLTLNMATARAIGFSPPWDILTQAELLHPEVTGAERSLSLNKAVREAVQANLDIRVADRAVAAGAENIREARSFLLPQVEIAGDARVIDADRARAGGGNLPERQVSGALALSQLLYDEPTWANLSIQKDIQVTREEQQNITVLDVVFEAAVGYLNVLAAKTTERIQQQNLDLTRANLEVARIRREIGVARTAEVVRWESQIANDRSVVINSFAQRQQTEIALNRVLHRPLEEQFRTEEPTLDDPLLLSSFAKIFPYVDNPRFFEIFRDFMVQEGLSEAPELRLIDAQIRAQERQLLSDQRVFWSPTVALRAGVSAAEGGGDGSSAPTFSLGAATLTLPQNDAWSWEVGATASLPLFEGFGRVARRERSREELARFRIEREATAERIAARIRSTLYEAGASYANIDLAHEAARAAKRNYELVLDAYREGVGGILDILDAQNDALNSNLNAANAVYVYLINLMSVQRAVGQFDFFVSAAGRREWFKKLDAFFAEHGAAVTK
jgi:outer membrane protein